MDAYKVAVVVYTCILKILVMDELTIVSPPFHSTECYACIIDYSSTNSLLCIKTLNSFCLKIKSPYSLRKSYI